MSCELVLSDAEVEVLAPPEVLGKFVRFGLQSFVEQCPALKQCRSPHCDLVLRLTATVSISTRILG